MAILFVGSRAIDLGGACIQEFSASYYDVNFSSECAKCKALFSEVSNGFNLAHGAAASDTVWYHFYVRTGGPMADTTNDGYWFTIYNAAGDEICRWDILNGESFAQVFGDTTVSGIAFRMAEEAHVTIDIKVVVGANITMECYINGALQSTATAANTGGKLGPTDFVMQHEDMILDFSGSFFYYSEFIITDNESTLNWRLATLTPNAQGNYDQWNGTFSDIINFGDGLSINTDIANQKESWTLSGYNGPATTSGVRAVVNSFFGTKGAAGPTQITPFIRHAATDVEGATVTPDGRFSEVLQNNPQTGLPWDTADLATLEIGVKSTA